MVFVYFKLTKNGLRYDEIVRKIGRVDGKDISNDFIKSIFKKTKIKVTIDNKMNDYLKTHACTVLPLVFASYNVYIRSCNECKRRVYTFRK